MLRKLLMVLGALLLVLAALTIWIGMPHGPDIDQVAHLTAPRIVDLPAQNVLVATVKGDPNVVGSQGFGAVMKAYFQLDNVPKWGEGFPAPRARWPIDLTTPKSEWTGLYAMPVPESVATAPAHSNVELTTWTYGPVAEILHVGPYDQEPPTVQRLMAFIAASGYEVAGMHEEEYLKGPGFLFSGNEEDYLTIIRYPVTRMDSTATSIEAE